MVLSEVIRNLRCGVIDGDIRKMDICSANPTQGP